MRHTKVSEIYRKTGKVVLNGCELANVLFQHVLQASVNTFFNIIIKIETMANLQIRFHNDIEFQKAIYFIANHSIFYAEEDKEWNMLVVDCADQQDAALNEKEFETELIENGFEDYYFELED